MEALPTKPVREDWRFFNEAAEKHAAYLNGLVVPKPLPEPPPVPPQPVDWLRRGLGVGSVLLSAGIAASLILWAREPPRPPAPIIAAAPPPPAVQLPPAMTEPKASQAENVVVNYTMFTNVQLTFGMVQTGWDFDSSKDTRPSRQFCHVAMPKPDAPLTDFWVILADTKHGIYSYNAHDMAPLSHANYDEALPQCHWFERTTLPPPGKPA
jgi:hypothetical protein